MANATSEAITRKSPRDYFIIPRLFVATVLLIAAGMKVHQMATQPMRPAGSDAGFFEQVLADRGFNLFEIHFEFVLACWLLSGWARRPAWLATLGCFVLFSLITLHKHLSGEASCGCFGAAIVPPIYTFVLDVSIVLMLVVLHPRLRNAGPILDGSPWQLAVGLAAALAAVVLTTVPVTRFRTPTLTAAAIEVEEAMPETWVGLPLPLFGHFNADVARQLQAGQWLVVVVHDGCTGCAALVPELERKARAMPPGRKPRVALLFKDRPGDSPAVPADGLFLVAQLDASREWNVPSSTVVWLKDGVVAEVAVPASDQDRAKVLARDLPAGPATQPNERQ
jgi:hypothetical protein